MTAKVEGVHRDLSPGQSLRYIRCDLLECSGGQWGYKPLDESMHPYYYSCPLSYLDLAPEQSADWRAGVRAYHARRRTPTVAMASATVLRSEERRVGKGCVRTFRVGWSRFHKKKRQNISIQKYI